MVLNLFNTLSQNKEVFFSRIEGKAGVYSCGPTVYERAHIGNLRSYIFTDILIRTLNYNDYAVNHVLNITDVGHLVGDGNEGEDKVEKTAREKKMSAMDISEHYTKLFFQDTKELNILKPTTLPKATAHIKEQIEFIQELENKGYTYKISDGLYFDTEKLSDYGKLANVDISQLKEGARVERNPEKRNPTDFALWKFSPKNENRQMEWQSPWGVGFPGWSIECSAMATKYLGEHFDVHTGGIDHINTHHTNEIAQNEARFGHKTVNYWLHGEFVRVNNKKMSKSLGNLITLDDIKEKGYSPITYRYLCLQTHYRQKLNFSWNSLESSAVAFKRLIRAFSAYKIAYLEESNKDSYKSKNVLAEFHGAVNDDLNTPKALAILWDLIKSEAYSPNIKYSVINNMDKVLGLNLENEADLYIKLKNQIPDEVHSLAEERELARANKDWQKADELRAKINNLGYFIEDTADGVTITKNPT